MKNDNVKCKNVKRVAVILINFKDYANKFLSDCLKSLRTQEYPGEMKIFIVDNESTGESYEYLKNALTEIQPPSPPLSGGQYEIIRNKNNDGFAKGNNDAIKLALKQSYEYIILFNMDTVIDESCVREMVEAAEIQPPKPPLSGGQTGAVQARIMLYPDKELVNSLGNVTHFLGFGFSEGYGEKYNPPCPPCQGSKSICYPSGAAVLYKAEALKKVGLFDEEFWMYNEDQDLGWRIWLTGFKCVLAEKAVVYHKYEFNRSIQKYYWMDRNRIIAILKNYHWATLILILPAFLVMEIGLLIFSAKGGWFKEKINVYKYFLKVSNWRYILRTRKETQKLRQVKDRKIIKMFSGKIWYQEIGDRKLKIANVFFNAYWQVAKFLIKW